MSEAVIHIPVQCPACGKKSLAHFPVLVIVTAITRQDHLRLYSACHDISWDASNFEMQAVRQFLGAEWIESHCP
jgi:hypothetical protein